MDRGRARDNEERERERDSAATVACQSSINIRFTACKKVFTRTGRLALQSHRSKDETLMRTLVTVSQILSLTHSTAKWSWLQSPPFRPLFINTTLYHIRISSFPLLALSKSTLRGCWKWLHIVIHILVERPRLSLHQTANPPHQTNPSARCKTRGFLLTNSLNLPRTDSKALGCGTALCGG